MQILKSLFNFYIHSSIHVALAVVAFVVFRLQVSGINLEMDLILFLFLASVSGYNFVKYAGVAKLYHRSLTKQLRSIQLFSALAFIGMLYFFFQLSVQSMLLLLGLSLVNFLYAFPVFKNQRNLRNLSGVKVFVIALVWAVSTVCFPAVEYDVKFDAEMGLIFIQQLLMLVALMIPFEIRDFRFDEKSLQTLPQIFGIWKTKLIGIFILFICLIISMYLGSSEFSFTLIFSLFLSIFILFSSKQQNTYYASFWVEAVPIMSCVLYFFIF